MTGAILLREDESLYQVPFHEYLSSYIKASGDFMEGMRRGTVARREGNLKPWPEIKEKLGIG